MIFYRNIRRQFPFLKILFQFKSVMHAHCLRITFSKCFFKNIGPNLPKNKSHVCLLFLFNVTVFSFRFKNSIKRQVRDHSKRESHSEDGNFQLHLLLHATPRHFFPNTSVLCHSLENEKLWQKRRRFLYKWTYSLSQWVHTFSHKDTHVLTSHSDKVEELLFFEVSNTVNSKAQWTFWICLYCFSL